MEKIFRDGRLTKKIYPITYDLAFIIDGITEYSGSTIITIQFSEETDVFALHSKNITVIQIKLDDIDVKYEYDEKNELVIIKSDKIIDIGKRIITIVFKGKINTDAKGLYVSKYMQDEKEHHLFATQFESTDARCMFPCFDEPDKKAMFKMTVIHKKGLTVLSNTSTDKIEKLNDENTITTFKQTVIMSSYLVALVIGEFEYIEKITDSECVIRVYGLKKYKYKMDFALTISKKVVQWFEKWFGIKYALDKIDLIGIPDFNAGAMENWGLITFRPELLYCGNDIEFMDKKDIVVTIIHEIAHQWFGNLVTMEWWTYLWLNESMATYFGWFVADILFPEWNIWDIFIDNEYKYALNLDSLKSSHPIEVPIKNSNEINQIFDGISYAKGACLIRCLVNILGGDEFRKGMQLYMRKNIFKNTKSINLWNSFSPSIDKIMSSWLSQTGYPLLIIEKNINSDKKMEIKLTQQKFLKSGKTDDTLWIIPLNICFDDGSNEDINIENFEYIFTYDVIQNFVINPFRYSFCRVLYKYDIDITNYLPRIQKQIIDDSFACSFAGLHDINISFNLIKSVELKCDYNILNSVITNITAVFSIMKHDDIFIKKYKTYVYKYFIDKIKKIFDILTFQDVYDEEINDVNCRIIIIKFLVSFDDETIKLKAFELFNKKEYKYILPIIGKYASKSYFDKLIELMDTSDDPQIKDLVLDGLGNTTNLKIINILLDKFILNNLRHQDKHHILFIMANNELSRKQTYEFIKLNWLKFDYKVGSAQLSSLIKALGQCVKSIDELNDFIKFMADKLNDGIKMIYEQCIERIQNDMNTMIHLQKLIMV
jgi:aminopeptidase N